VDGLRPGSAEDVYDADKQPPSPELIVNLNTSQKKDEKKYAITKALTEGAHYINLNNYFGDNIKVATY